MRIFPPSRTIDLLSPEDALALPYNYSVLKIGSDSSTKRVHPKMFVITATVTFPEFLFELISSAILLSSMSINLENE